MNTLDTFVNRRTQTGSPEAAIQTLVRQAALAVQVYRNKSTNPFTGEHDVEAKTRAYTLVNAVETVTFGELTLEDFITYSADQK